MQRNRGYFGLLSHQLSNAYRAVPLRPGDYGGGLWGWLGALTAWILKPAWAVFSILYAHLDVHHKYNVQGQCKNYAVVAIKNASGPDKRMNPHAE